MTSRSILIPTTPCCDGTTVPQGHEERPKTAVGKEGGGKEGGGVGRRVARLQDTPRPTRPTHHPPSPRPPLHSSTILDHHPPYTHDGSIHAQRLAPHDIGLQAEGVAYSEAKTHTREALLDGSLVG